MNSDTKERNLKALEAPMFTDSMNCFQRDDLGKWAAAEIRSDKIAMDLLSADAIELAQCLQDLVNVGVKGLRGPRPADSSIQRAEGKLTEFMLRDTLNPGDAADIVQRCFSKTYVMSCYSSVEQLYANMADTLHDAGREIISLGITNRRLRHDLDTAIGANKIFSEENDGLRQENHKFNSENLRAVVQDLQDRLEVSTAANFQYITLNRALMQENVQLNDKLKGTK